MSDLKNAAEGFLEGFSGGGLFVRSVRAHAPIEVFAPSTDPRRAVILLEELESMLTAGDRNGNAGLRVSMNDEEAVSLRHLLQRVRSAVMSAPTK